MAITFTGMGVHGETQFGGSNGLRLFMRSGGDRRLRDALAVFAGEKIGQTVMQPQRFRIKASA
jgi:hypothetical protein